MKPFLIVKTGGTYPDIAARFGDFEDWFMARMDRSVAPIEIASPFMGQPLPPVASLGGIIITGSHDMVTDQHPWSEKTAGWIKQAVAAQVPVLGICYGHQLLADAFGGVVGDNPNGIEFGTVSIRLSQQGRQDPLFAGLPARVAVHSCHRQSVLQLPVGATVLASSDMDSHPAFAIGQRVWGLQFHPEFDTHILRRYIQRFASDLRAQGDDVDHLLAETRETPFSEGLLKRFQRLCA